MALRAMQGYGHVDDAPVAHREQPWTTRCVAHRRTLRPHAHSHLRMDKRQRPEDNFPPVTFLREATRPAKIIVANQSNRQAADRASRHHSHSRETSRQSEPSVGSRASGWRRTRAQPATPSSQLGQHPASFPLDRLAASQAGHRPRRAADQESVRRAGCEISHGPARGSESFLVCLPVCCRSKQTRSSRSACRHGRRW